MKRETALSLSDASKHQYYYKTQGEKTGKKAINNHPSVYRRAYHEHLNNEVVFAHLKYIQSDPDTNYGYYKMTFALNLPGCIFNHQKVYRLMDLSLLLKEKWQKCISSFVKFLKILPNAPLQVLEMDIKFIWIEEHRRHEFVLTVIDTFTWIESGWKAAFQIRQEMVKQLWTDIIGTQLQPYDCLNNEMNIEVRNDNDSRFMVLSLPQFFRENHLG